ncbi:MAG: hypothetical protein PVI06_01295 [Desulfobacterales bacterium]
MLELDLLTRRVLRNCDITDSKHAGLYSICGLALRLRDLYKWEKRLDPWVEKDSSEILEWIGNKESMWDTLAEEDYLQLPILGKIYEPFDTNGINAALEPHGLFYGAGYARSLKPTFFLAPIVNKKKINEFTVYTLGQELARDLLTIPALTQDNCILLRRESGRLFLWDQIFYIKKSGRPALNFALAACGIKERNVKALQRSLATIYQIQQETYIYHEVGEIRDTVFDAELWRQIIAAFPQTPVELLTRTVKDLLADMNKYGPLQHIIKKRHAGLLAFYVAFLDGLAKELFPEIGTAFMEFAGTRNWQVIEQAVSVGYNTARSCAEEIVRIFLKGKQKKGMIWAQNEIEKKLLKKRTSRRKSL